MPKNNLETTQKKLDPRIKIIATIGLTILTFASSSYFTQSLLLIIVIASTFAVKIPAGYLIRKLRTPLLMVTVMLALQIMMMPHIGAFANALLSFIRLTIVIISWFILSYSTSQTTIILALESFLQPVEYLGIKTGMIILIFKIIQRFVPSLFEEAHKILNAQASRGIDIKNAKIWRKMYLIGALLLPVFVISLKRADDLSNAMAVRGYVLNQKRTNYQTLKR